MAVPIHSASSTPAPVGASDPERRLAELARVAGPLRRVLAALAGRLVLRRAWDRLGYARLGDYARERLGISARSVQEFARVDRALAELPLLEAALCDGQLPWSKVRMLARFAARTDERHWIGVAAGMSVRELERTCRAVDRGALEARALSMAGDGRTAATRFESDVDEEGRSDEASEWVRLGASVPLAFKWRRTVEAAAKVAGEPLSAAGALEWVTAEALSALPLEPEDLAQTGEGAECDRGRRAEGPIRTGLLAVDALNSASEPIDPPAGAETASSPDTTAAEEAARASGKPAMLGAVHAARTPGAVCSMADGAGPRPGLPRFLDALLKGLEHVGAHELDARLRRAVRLEQRLDAEVGPLLRRVTAPGYEWRERFHTLGAFARDALGMSPRKARALLRLERVGDVCPELRYAYRDGALSWVQAQALAPLLVRDDEGDWRRAWVDWASTVAVRRLEDVVAHALLLCETDAGTWEELQAEPDRIAALLREGQLARPTDEGHADGPAGGASKRQTCARTRESIGDVRIRVRVPSDVARLFRAVLCTVRRAEERASGRLPTEAEAFEAMIDHALESWGVDDRWLRRTLRQRYAVFERDGWRCTVPGCTSRRNLHAHHIRFRSAGGADTLENQTTLCAHHHLRGVHGGTVRITGSAPGALWFELGNRTGGPALARYRSGDRLA